MWQLVTSLRGNAMRFQLRITIGGDGAVLVDPEVAAAVPAGFRGAVERDLVGRVVAAPEVSGVVQRACASQRAAIRDPAWVPLRDGAAGEAWPTAPLHRLEDRDATVRGLTFDALVCRILDDDDGFHARWHRLITNPHVDERVFAGLALCMEDASLRASIREAPPRDVSLDSLWTWLQASPAPPSAGAVWPTVPLQSAARTAARAALLWGQGEDVPARTAYGFPVRDELAPCAPRTRDAGLEERHARLVSDFLRDGYATLRGAIPRASLFAWARCAAADFRRDYAEDPGIAPEAEFPETLDPARSSSAFRGRLEWQTSNAIPVHLFSMEFAEAVGALVGGLDRLDGAFGERLLFTCASPHPFELVPAGLVRDEQWHIDETRADGRLDNQHLALLAIVLLTDVGMGDGPTAFLLRSPEAVASALPRAGRGQDQDDRAWTKEIARGAGPVIHATGRAGDVFFLHPLTLHTGSQSVRPRLRIVSNPNLRARQPLRYREPSSPVEQYIADRL